MKNTVIDKYNGKEKEITNFVIEKLKGIPLEYATFKTKVYQQVEGIKHPVCIDGEEKDTPFFTQLKSDTYNEFKKYLQIQNGLDIKIDKNAELVIIIKFIDDLYTRYVAIDLLNVIF